MATATVDGLSISYDLVDGGEGGPAWILTPGGRFSKDDAGLHELAEALVDGGGRAVVWDRPNCGASDLCFDGPSESVVQADALAGLVRALELGPVFVVGGSGGSRVSLLAAARHPDVARGVAMWWITGGVYGLLSLATHYCGGSLRAAWEGGMEAVAALPEWAESLERNPANRERLLALDPADFVATMERWMQAYVPDDDALVPGLTEAEARACTLPALVFRSGTVDLHHRRATSERVAAGLPNARLVEPPWGDAEWPERQAERTQGITAGLFVRWPLLAPQLRAWAEEVSG
jgi:pimeloyl-ACP methyl ester carboxylesterase